MNGRAPARFFYTARVPIDRPLLQASWRSWYGNDLKAVGPLWLQFVWTFVFSFMVGLGFFVLGLSMQVIGSGRWPSVPGLLEWFFGNQVISQVIGFTIHGLFAAIIPLVGAQRIRAFSNRQRAVFFSAIPMAGVAIGWPVGALLLGHSPGHWSVLERPAVVAGMLLFSFLVCFLFYQHFDTRARQFEAEKRAAEAQLRLLQGQMEPHFMFNTLANVLGLIDTDASRAKQMLETFIEYLRASLGQLRSGDSTLGDELMLTEAYLNLMRHRMGERLRFEVHVEDPVLRSMPMPPLLLQPLVENAIHHGLECKVDGGTVRINARRDAGQLVVEVIDDGLGACERPARRAGAAGNGVALANLRARLASHYGGRAALALDLEPDAGARAALTLPLDPPAHSPA